MSELTTQLLQSCADDFRSARKNRISGLKKLRKITKTRIWEDYFDNLNQLIEELDVPFGSCFVCGDETPTRAHLNASRKTCSEKCKQIYRSIYTPCNKPKCLDCGIEISYNSKHCNPCGGVYKRKPTAKLHRKLSNTLRSRIHSALQHPKNHKTIDYLGCSIREFRNYIESKFLPGMSWDNHSLNGWHIDHIRPLASFDLTDPEQVKQAFHYTNTQPLWACDNMKKHAKYNA